MSTWSPSRSRSRTIESSSRPHLPRARPSTANGRLAATSTTRERWPRSPRSGGCARSSGCRPARPRRSSSSRELLRDGYVGEVLSTTMIGVSVPGDVVVQPNVYMLDRDNGANLLTVAAGHSLDTLNHVLGEFADLSAVSAIRRPLITAEGTGEQIVKTARRPGRGDRHPHVRGDRQHPRPRGRGRRYRVPVGNQRDGRDAAHHRRGRSTQDLSLDRRGSTRAGASLPSLPSRRR